MEKGKPEQNYDACQMPQGHREHLCNLMDRGMTEEVRRRSGHPAFVCGNCGAQADTQEDLCNPESLPGR